MKSAIKLIFAFILTTNINHSYAQIAGATIGYEDYTTIPEEVGVLIVDTSIPELSKSHEIYVFTKEDALWMARFVTGEAGVKNNANGHAVLWAMFNRFGILRHQVKSWSSFGEFLQQYSTTLQPILKSKGAAQRVWKNHYKNPEAFPIVKGSGFYKGTNIQKVQYKKHVLLQQMEWEDIHVNIRKMVLSILQGEIANPGIGMATEFAGTHIYYKQKHNTRPNEEQWRAYTIDYAENRCKKGMRGCTWIGDVEGLNQRSKNAFFIDNRFKDVPSDAIWIDQLY
jgi:hypothetical protein